MHAVHLQASEIAALARAGSSVAHCPSSNLKLASGFARVGELLAHGVNVGIGTDGAASNNRLDMFQEMRTTALLAKGVAGSAEAVPAREALRLATLGSARALGLDATIGSIVPGKWADLVAVALSSPETQPCFDPLSHLVYACGREHVTDVWVAGEAVVAGRQLTRIDPGELEKRAALWQNRLVRRSS